MICRRCLHLFKKDEKISSKKTASASVHADSKICAVNLKPYKVKTMKAAILLFALALSGTLCRAQSVLSEAPQPKHTELIYSRELNKLVPVPIVEHRFLDVHNITIFSTVAVAMSADGFTTRSGVSSGHVELNPLARPFVTSDRKMAATQGACFAATVSSMLLLHHLRRHKAERVLGWIIAGGEFSAATINAVNLHN